MFHLLLGVLSWVNLTDAFKSFDPNCSLPSEPVNYVFPPGVRGTMPIVWSCLSALLLCTWAVQHLAVPLHNEDENSSWNAAFQNKIRELWPKVIWMSVTLMMPEYVLGKALTEYLAAHHSRREFGQKDWTVTHAYFANMRGFVLRFEVAAVKTSLAPSKATPAGRKLMKPGLDGETPYAKQEGSEAIELEQCRLFCEEHTSNQTHSSDTVKTVVAKDTSDMESQKTHAGVESDHEMQRLPSIHKELHPKQDSSKVTPEVSALKSHKLWKGKWPLNAMQMYYAYRTGIIADLPTVTAEELSDRSKGDALINFAAVFQITWLVIQIITRAIQHLAITLFEITVLAFAACALLTYLLFWQKPQDVKVPCYIDASNVLTRENVIELAARSHVSSIFAYEFWLHGVVIRGMSDNVFPTSPGIPFKLPWMKEKAFLNPVILGIGLGGSIFGAIHFAAWNFEFPTPVEQLLWRVSCCILFSFPLLASLIYWMIQRIVRSLGVVDKDANLAFKPVEYIMVLLYLVARLYLFVEVFRSLAYLPSTVFQEVQWPNAIPYVN
jgi:hypothetical protein